MLVETETRSCRVSRRIHHHAMGPNEMSVLVNRLASTVPAGDTVIGCGIVTYALLGLYRGIFGANIGMVRKKGDDPVAGRIRGEVVGNSHEFTRWWFFDDMVLSQGTLRHAIDTIGFPPVGVITYMAQWWNNPSDMQSIYIGEDI